jgi:hypothetical protein
MGVYAPSDRKSSRTELKELIEDFCRAKGYSTKQGAVGFLAKRGVRTLLRSIEEDMWEDDARDLFTLIVEMIKDAETTAKVLTARRLGDDN